jgi:hypothetical protein
MLQFRIKAASRAILELERLQQPVVSNQVSSTVRPSGNGGRPYFICTATE